MKKGGFAFHVDTSYAYRMINDLFNEEEVCELAEVSLFPIRQLTSMLTIDSPLREFFVVGLQRLKETGLIDRTTRHWTGKKPKCLKSVMEVKSLDIEQASTIFIFLFAAICLSFLILFAEIVYFKIRKF